MTIFKVSKDRKGRWFTKVLVCVQGKAVFLNPLLPSPKIRAVVLE